MAVVPEEDFEHVARELARVLGPEMARLERERDVARAEVVTVRRAAQLQINEAEAIAADRLRQITGLKKRAARWKQAAKAHRAFSPEVRRERARKARGEE